MKQLGSVFIHTMSDDYKEKGKNEKKNKYDKKAVKQPLKAIVENIEYLQYRIFFNVNWATPFVWNCCKETNNTEMGKYLKIRLVVKMRSIMAKKPIVKKKSV